MGSEGPTGAGEAADGGVDVRRTAAAPFSLAEVVGGGGIPIWASEHRWTAGFGAVESPEDGGAVGGGAVV